MTRMTIDIPNDEYKRLKISAINADLSIKDYVLNAIRFQEKVLVREDGVVRILNDETIAALEESRGDVSKLKKFNSVEELMKELEN